MCSLNIIGRKWRFVACVSLFALLPLMREAKAQGQPATRRAVTIEQAIEYALQNYPAVRASLEDLSAAHAAIGLARTAYLPQLSGVYQESRATLNQVDGIWLPTSLNPAVEGPVQPYSGQSFWGSQGAALFSWSQWISACVPRAWTGLDRSKTNRKPISL